MRRLLIVAVALISFMSEGQAFTRGGLVVAQCLNFVADGDSITFGVGTNTVPYATTIASALGVTGSNQGIVGAGWNYNFGGGSLIGTAPAAVDPLLSSLSCGSLKPILIGFAGTNDLNTTRGNNTPAQAYAFFQTWFNARIAAGWPAQNIFVPTMISITSADVSDANRVAYNDLLIAGATSQGYTIVPTGADANLGCNGCFSNSTYFQSDGIHPTNTGAAIIANLICVAIKPNVGTCPAY
jgi:lysophospholipase L1-like esterase